MNMTTPTRTPILAWSAVVLAACAGDPDGGAEAVVQETPGPSGSATVAVDSTSSVPANGSASNSGTGSALPPNVSNDGTGSNPPSEPPGSTASGAVGNGTSTPTTTAPLGIPATPTPSAGAPSVGAGGMPSAPSAMDSGGSANGAAGTGETAAGGTDPGSGDQGGERLDGVSDDFSFFVTSYFHIRELSGSDDGFGGNLSYAGKIGIEGADAICQEMASRVGFNNRTWRAYLSTSTVNAKDRVGTGPWYDFAGNLVAENVEGLLVGKSEGEQGGMGMGMGGGGFLGGMCAGVDNELDRPLGGALDCGTYDELGLFHDGSTDQDNDGIEDDDHDTMTATLADGTYAGFSCEDWTSTTAMVEESAGEEQGGGQLGGGAGLRGGIMMGHSWAAGSGMHWSESHGGHACAAGTNFIQDGPGDSATVGGGGGYGGFYCFALAE